MSSNERDSASEEPRRFTYQIGDRETVIEAILRAVGTVTDIPIGPQVDEAGSVQEAHDQPPPLYKTIDVEALLFLSSDPSNVESWHVTFPYCGCEVTVASDDTVVVEERSSVAEDY